MIAISVAWCLPWTQHLWNVLIKIMFCWRFVSSMGWEGRREDACLIIFLLHKYSVAHFLNKINLWLFRATATDSCFPMLFWKQAEATGSCLPLSFSNREGFMCLRVFSVVPAPTNQTAQEVRDGAKRQRMSSLPVKFTMSETPTPRLTN